MDLKFTAKYLARRESTRSKSADTVGAEGVSDNVVTSTPSSLRAKSSTEKPSRQVSSQMSNATKSDRVRVISRKTSLRSSPLKAFPKEETTRGDDDTEHTPSLRSLIEKLKHDTIHMDTP